MTVLTLLPQSQLCVTHGSQEVRLPNPLIPSHASYSELLLLLSYIFARNHSYFCSIYSVLIWYSTQIIPLNNCHGGLECCCDKIAWTKRTDEYKMIKSQKWSTNQNHNCARKNVYAVVFIFEKYFEQLWVLLTEDSRPIEDTAISPRGQLDCVQKISTIAPNDHSFPMYIQPLTYFSFFLLWI